MPQNHTLPHVDVMFETFQMLPSLGYAIYHSHKNVIISIVG
jgi:hypothetical protein